MGCGSSSLKGEKVDGLEGARPARKVQTNFSDVDFNSGAAADRRGTMAVAPDEQQRSRPSKISESSVDGARDVPTTSTTTQKAEHEGAKLEPYKSIDAPEGGSADALRPKSQATPEVQLDTAPKNEEAATLATAGNPVVPPAKA